MCASDRGGSYVTLVQSMGGREDPSVKTWNLPGDSLDSDILADIITYVGQTITIAVLTSVGIQGVMPQA
jgi:hypothetical protein